MELNMLVELHVRAGQSDIEELARARAEVESEIRRCFGPAVDVQYAQGITVAFADAYRRVAWVRGTFEAG